MVASADSNKGCSEENTGAQEEASTRYVELRCSDASLLCPKVRLFFTAVAFQLRRRRCVHDGGGGGEWGTGS